MKQLTKVTFVFLFSVAVISLWAFTGIGQADSNGSGAPNNVVTSLANEVDALFFSEQDEQRDHAAEVSDTQYLRRVYLDLVGQQPTPNELTLFLLDPDPQKRANVVDRLLADPRFGVNWAFYFTDDIWLRKTETIRMHSQLASFFAKELNKKNPTWDVIADQIIRAEGSIKKNGAIGLLISQVGADNRTSEVMRFFTGIQVTCANCHDHPWDRWQRDQFHELAAFFSRISIGRDGKRDFYLHGEDAFRKYYKGHDRYGRAEHAMANLEAPEEPGDIKRPVFLMGDVELDNGATDATRRRVFSEAMTSADNIWFSRAFVNRIWSELTSHNFYDNPDDLGPDRDPYFPQTLELLGNSFTDSGYDIKQLFRVIIATDVYQLQSRSGDDVDELANRARRLRASQVLGSISAALDLTADEAAELGKTVIPKFRYDPCAPRETAGLSFPQALFSMNAPLVSSKIDAASENTRLGRLVKSKSNDADVVTELYLHVLARLPSDDELASCVSYVADAATREKGFEDVMWSLLNIPEFFYRD